MFKKKQDHTLKIVLGIVGLGVTVVGTIAGGFIWKKKKENSVVKSDDFETYDLPEEAVDTKMEESNEESNEEANEEAREESCEESNEEIDEDLIDEIVVVENILTEEELKLLSEL